MDLTRNEKFVHFYNSNESLWKTFRPYVLKHNHRTGNRFEFHTKIFLHKTYLMSSCNKVLLCQKLCKRWYMLYFYFSYLCYSTCIWVSNFFFFQNLWCMLCFYFSYLCNSTCTWCSNFFVFQNLWCMLYFYFSYLCNSTYTWCSNLFFFQNLSVTKCLAWHFVTLTYNR